MHKHTHTQNDIITTAWYCCHQNIHENQNTGMVFFGCIVLKSTLFQNEIHRYVLKFLYSRVRPESRECKCSFPYAEIIDFWTVSDTKIPKTLSKNQRNREYCSPVLELATFFSSNSIIIRVDEYLKKMKFWLFFEVSVQYKFEWFFDLSIKAKSLNFEWNSKEQCFQPFWLFIQKMFCFKRTPFIIYIAKKVLRKICMVHLLNSFSHNRIMQLI